MKVTLLTYTPEPEKMVAAAAKLCYSPVGIDEILENLTEKKVEGFLRMLTELGHESPIEHVSFTFAAEGVSRSLLAQLTRHRIASYSVQSQRYVEKDGFDYVIPPEIEQDARMKAIFIQAMEDDRRAYQTLTELLTEKHLSRMDEAERKGPKANKDAKKKALEDARYVLSNACDTKIVFTMNARSLKNFFALRTCNRAQWEIRAMAEEMLRQVKRVCPLLFSDAGPSCVRGACAEGSYSCGRAAEMRKKWRRETTE